MSGAERYRVGGEVAIEQQLTLDLSLDGQPSRHLDSGLMAGGGVFPRRIDVSASSGGQCFVTRVDLHAQRLPPRPAPRVRP